MSPAAVITLPPPGRGRGSEVLDRRAEGANVAGETRPALGVVPEAGADRDRVSALVVLAHGGRVLVPRIGLVGAGAVPGEDLEADVVGVVGIRLRPPARHRA